MKFLFCIILFSLHHTLLSQPYGLETRIPNESLLISTYGDTLAEMKLTAVFKDLAFSGPVYLTHAGDGSNRLFLVEKKGVICVFPNDIHSAHNNIFLDISGQVNAGPSEAGLLSIAFHPEYETNGAFYVYYTYGNLHSRISEFTVSSDPDSADPASERVLLEVSQPYTNHNGGQLAFGPDGFLYIGFGDGGSGGDPLGNGQNTHTLHGSILRIDIDRTTDSTAYDIPADNPFYGFPESGRAEIWAWGLRNPWRFSFDFETGYLWAGDVGQNAWEEIDIIESGKNYGWNIMEGFHCYRSTSCDTSGLTLPVLEYNHSTGKSVTGGFVYRGPRLERLKGIYLYGDYVTRRIWGLDYSAGRIQDHKLIAESPVAISSFGSDEAGEVYVVGYDGSIYRFDEKEGNPPVNPVPRTISESGLYSDMEQKTVAPGIIPYSVNLAFWSDRAEKERFIALPGTTQIGFSENGFWTFPNSSVIVKNFYLEMERGNPGSRQLVETRFLVKHSSDESWDGYSYAWSDDETDAVLLDSNYTKTFTVTSGDSSISQSWYYPGRNECTVCHTPAAGYVLGLRTPQINGEHTYGDITDNQLRSYNHIELFTEDIGEDYSSFPRFVHLSDSSVSIQSRARTYLDVNCANCHRAGGSGRTSMDLRYDIPLDEANLVNAHTTLDNPGSIYRLRPGVPDSSDIFLRMTDPGEYRMPPLASFLIDQEGAEHIRSWIISLDDSVEYIDDSNIIAGNFHLYPVYPNPFNTVTTIRYAVGAYGNTPQRVELTIHNNLGQTIATLVSEKQPAGTYTIKWDASNRPSGVYYCRLKTDRGDPARFQTVKMILIK